MLGAEAGGAPRVGEPAASRAGARACAPPGTTRAATAEVRIHVCVTCRAEGDRLEPRDRAGRAPLRRAERARARRRPAGRSRVECFSVCKRPCTVGFSAPGKWTYVYGDFPADADPADILAAARLYAAAPTA